MTMSARVAGKYLCILFLLVGGIFLLSAQLANAQGLVQCGIGTTLAEKVSCQFCDLFKLVDVLIKYLILAGVTLAALMFTYAGFLYFTSGGNTEKASKAKTIFIDVVLGFIFALIGFLIIDTILNTVAAGYLKGPSWNTVACVSNRNLFGTGTVYQGSESSITSSAGSSGGSSVNPVVLSGDCASGNLPQPSDGSWNAQQMKVMSCIAQAESTCNPNAQYNGPALSNATGLYQMIIGGFNDPGHNLNFASCSAAAGVTGNLNCYDRYIAGGKQLRSSQLDPCFTAAKNVQCNTDAANYLMQQACIAGNCYKPWETAPRCM